jgi:hypothetical protein
MVWGAAKNGKFTVRSAYHVAKDVGFRYLGAVQRIGYQIVYGEGFGV